MLYRDLRFMRIHLFRNHEENTKENHERVVSLYVIKTHRVNTIEIIILLARGNIAAKCHSTAREKLIATILDQGQRPLHFYLGFF